MSLHDEKVDWLTKARQESNMATARLEHDILQTIMNHILTESPLSTQEITHAVLNVSLHFQKRIMHDNLIKQREELFSNVQLDPSHG